METKYPTLRRPKRKLCYLTNKESSAKQWTGTLTLGDVDKMFDDLDPPSHDDDGPLPPSPLLQTFDIETNQNERETPQAPQEGRLMEKLPRCQTHPEGDVLHPVMKSPSLKLNIDLDFPFKAHGPVKTSSPIEGNMVVERLEGVEELDKEKDRVVSPVLFASEDEEKEETEPLPTQKRQCNGLILEQSDDSELESPPSKVVLSQPKMSSGKNRVEGSCKESHTVKEKTPMKPQTAGLEGKRKTQRQENTHRPVSAVRREPEVAAPKKKSESVDREPSVEASNRVRKDMTTFLQKLRDAGQPKPACPRKSPSSVRLTAPPEPEDDFLILEDDTPLWFSIPCKTATSKRQGRTFSTIKDSSTEKGATDSPPETAQKQQGSEEGNKLGGQTVNQKMKMMKGKGKKNQVTEPGNDMGELCSPEDLPADDLMEQERPNKKKQGLKKVPSKESDKAVAQPKDTASQETDEEKDTLKMEKKAQKSLNVKRSKSLKDGNENAKTSRSKSLKGGRKETQGSGAVKETVYVEAVKGQSDELSGEEHVVAKDLGSLSDREIINSEVQMDEKYKQNKPPVVSEESSSENSQTVGKRKRRQTGQWWLSCPESTEESKVTDSRSPPKKSKLNKKEPGTAVTSPVKTKKGGVLKRRNQTQPKINKAKEKKTKRNKNRNTGGDTPDKMKVFDAFEAEQIEEQEHHQQQEVLDQDLDPVQCSPLVFAHRDHSLNSGDQVFQRVYHHTSNEKTTITPALVSPRGSREQLRATEPGKRRRKPPSNWWMVNDMPEDVENISSRPQQQESEPQKERRKQSKQSRAPGLATPKNSSMAVSSKPLGGAPGPLLKVKPLPTPKTVKHSLATFKDIFASATETPAVVSSREAGHNNRRKVSAHPAVQVTVTDCATHSKTEDSLRMDPGDYNSPPSHEAPQDSKCLSDNTLKAVRSGPSSMIELEQYEENDDLRSMSDCELISSKSKTIPKKSTMRRYLQPNQVAQVVQLLQEGMRLMSRQITIRRLIRSILSLSGVHTVLPSSRIHAVLSASDLCAPPLKPLVLQPKDRANLTEWFKSLWSTTDEDGPQITPDQFDWYFYQGRAIGVLVDLNCGSICSGKILLGSFMKKPLWVDHSATTVFNLSTSSVRVTVDGRESRFTPGRSFMVPCGHAYSIQNVTAQPAVLNFTRILAESLD